MIDREGERFSVSCFQIFSALVVYGSPSSNACANLLAAPNPFIPMMRDNSLHPTGTAPIPPAAVFSSSALRRSHPPSAVAAWLQKQSAVAAAAAAAISCAAPSPTQQGCSHIIMLQQASARLAQRCKIWCPAITPNNYQ